MGITIHYTFITWDPLTVANTIKIVIEEANKAGYGYEKIAEDTWAFYAKTIIPIHDIRDFKGTLEYLVERYGGFRAVDRPLNEFPESPPFPYVVLVGYPEDGSYMYAIPWVSWPRRDYEYGVPTRIEGVIVDPPMVNGKPTAESFAILFYKIGRYYICNGFCKTQPFVMEEVEPNIRYHMWICSVLRRIADSSIMYHVYINDEAGYYETMDVSKIQESFTASSRFIWAFGSMLQDIVDRVDSSLSVEVAGTHSIREMKKKLEETYVEDAREAEEHGYERQTTLDEFGGGEDE